MKVRTAWGVLIALVVFYIGGAIYYYRFPEPFEVPLEEDMPGIAYTETLRIIGEEMVDHWPVNDIFFWPSNLLDNPQNFRLGQLQALRFSLTVLRENLSRMRADDVINSNINTAFNAFAIDADALILPRAEDKYAEGVEALANYENQLARGQARFYARIDNLREVLEQFMILLGATSQRLGALANDDEMFTANNVSTLPMRSEAGDEDVVDSLSWREVDDAFYYARGVAYVLSHLIVAVRHDFHDVIERRQVGTLFTSAIQVLESAQFEPWIVISANEESMFANHLLAMQAHIVNARQKLRAISQIIGASDIGGG